MIVMNKKDALYLYASIVCGLIIGFAFLYLAPDFPIRSDTLSFYHPIAQNLADGNGFTIDGNPTARVAPLYPFLLSIIYTMGGDFYSMYILQVFLLAGIGAISFLIAKKFIPPIFAFLASLNITAWPYLLLYTKFALTEIVFIFFLIWSVFYLLKFIGGPSVKNGVFAGLMIGLATLTRPTTLLFPFWIFMALTGLGLFLKYKKISFPGYKQWLLMIVAFVLVISPWTIRNFILFGEIIPITSGLEETTNRAYETLDYTQGSQIKENPTLRDNIFARIKNVYLFWNPGAEGTNAEFLLSKSGLFSVIFLLYKIIFISIAILALSSFLLPKKNPHLIILLITILYFWAIHTILYPYPRYTLPIIPLAIILSWITIYELWKIKLKRIQYGKIQT
jgi:hypothetical protein